MTPRFRLTATIAGLMLVMAAVPAICARRSAGTPATGASGYQLTKTIPVGGEGGWDYVGVDSGNRRVYVSRGTHVAVLDADSQATVGDIPDTQGVHGIAIAPELGRGFTSNGRAGTVSVFDPESLKVTATIKVTGENPDAILYEPVTKRVFTFNGRGKNATAIDAATGTVAGTVPLGGKPEFAASDPSGTVYVNIEDTAEIVAFDAASLAVKARWSLKPLEEPTGLAIDPKARRLFACGNRLLAVLSIETGKVVSTASVGAGCDAVAFEPESGLVYASAGDGTLAVARETAPGTFADTESAKQFALDAMAMLDFLGR